MGLYEGNNQKKPANGPPGRIRRPVFCTLSSGQGAKIAKLGSPIFCEHFPAKNALKLQF
ncbi:MAG: hypothetical protein LUG44_04120 [Clostridiales bacterium]|nr:hypothetical protein [Clostridiales bacterium]